MATMEAFSCTDLSGTEIMRKHLLYPLSETPREDLTKYL